MMSWLSMGASGKGGNSRRGLESGLGGAGEQRGPLDGSQPWAPRTLWLTEPGLSRGPLRLGCGGAS